MQTDKKQVRTNMYWLANAISFPGGGKRGTHRMFLWGKRLNMTPDQCWDEENMIRLTHQVLCHIGPFKMYRRFRLQENCSWNNTNIGSVLFSPQAMYITRWEGCGSPAILFRLRATCVSPSPVEFIWEKVQMADSKVNVIGVSHPKCPNMASVYQMSNPFPGKCTPGLHTCDTVRPHQPRSSRIHPLSTVFTQT